MPEGRRSVSVRGLSGDNLLLKDNVYNESRWTTWKNTGRSIRIVQKKKNADYGDAFAKYGLVGVLMRIEDKIQRGLSIKKWCSFGIRWRAEVYAIGFT